ncbi:cyun82 [Cyclophragma undans nucleopolyhedrovirus]|uniref:Cyun82 n=1 Tax=Cyclophragma undans nucleopolyhedrovirus TaxID=1906244 RepID=A0A288Q7J1_9ABAC|nr:cyun82 [Cyclophragma undans nucleopolyhedrovirus]AOT85540.1 cyun82 [Cyclophragma undans nucleopolyhedrovirus]
MQRKLNEIKHKLDGFSSASIKRARAKLFDAHLARKPTPPPRCWRKMFEIDKKFALSRGVGVFLDLCGGPGEFANYLLSSNPFVEGYGVTLTNNSKCVYRSHLIKRKNFTTISGPNATGDIFDKDVVFEISFQCGNRCDLVLADGAVDVSGRENEQEKINFDLIACETQMILIALRPGGCSVLKVFDAFDDKTVDMLTDFVSHFETYHVYKPPSSRPSNSERYLICINKSSGNGDGATQETRAAMRKKFNKFYKNQWRSLNLLIAELSRRTHV